MGKLLCLSQEAELAWTDTVWKNLRLVVNNFLFFSHPFTCQGLTLNLDNTNYADKYCQKRESTFLVKFIPLVELLFHSKGKYNTQRTTPIRHALYW